MTELKTKSLSGLSIPKVALPRYKDYGQILEWVYKENVPGSFPYTAGVFRSSEKGKIQSDNLQEKGHLNGRTAVFTTCPKMMTPSVSVRHSIPSPFTGRIPITVPISTGK